MPTNCAPRSTRISTIRDNGLYYLNIDVDGRARSDVTADLVFPVIFGVADEETAAGSSAA